MSDNRKRRTEYEDGARNRRIGNPEKRTYRDDDAAENPQKLSKKELKRLRVMKSRKQSLVLALIQLLLTIICIAEVIYLNIIPGLKLALGIIVLLLLSFYTFTMIKSRRFRFFGKIVSVLMIIVLLVSSIYIGKVNGILDKIAGIDTKTYIINVYVLKENSARNIKDAKDYTFGMLGSLDRENTNKAIDDINKEVGGKIATQDYSSWAELVDGLKNQEVGAIILNEGYLTSIIETEGYEKFEEETRVIHATKIVVKINVNNNKDVTENPFIMYVSGIDTRGEMTASSRSDVNILAVVNPKTKQVLLLNTPRDYYVPLAMNGELDKLTHAGIYGVDESMNTLAKLYDVDVDYYFRVNFIGFEKIIDALGGIDVYSDYDFTTIHGGYYYSKGMNHLNGIQALGFCRERYAFPAGDVQRGKNQMAVIQAVIQAMSAKEVLKNFSDLADSIKECFETSMSQSQISSLVKMQIDDGSKWNVVSYTVRGEGDTQPCYSLSLPNYVMWPDDTLIGNAKTLIKQVMDGEDINLDAVSE